MNSPGREPLGMTRRDEHHSPSIPSGKGGRAARLAVCSVFSGGAPAALLLVPQDAATPLVLRVIATGLLLMTVWLWVRLPFTGIRIQGTELVVTSWWSRATIARHDLSRFFAEPYDGPFYYFGWTINDGEFASGQLHAERTDGSHIVLRGTVSSLLTAKKIAREFNLWLEDSL